MPWTPQSRPLRVDSRVTSVIPARSSRSGSSGPFPCRAYAMFILAGIVVAVWITQRRLGRPGGKPGRRWMWRCGRSVRDRRRAAVPLVSSPQLYFGEGGHPLERCKVWNGGLGIWGAVPWAPGCLDRLSSSRSQLSRLRRLGCAGCGHAQAIGRWGNYFNNELFGAKTDLPWGLQIHCWDQGAGVAIP
jgi:prolipoprotein diacylglyceryltransferase